MAEIDVPEGWKEFDLGGTALYAEDTATGYQVRYIRTSDYFGGQDMYAVYRLDPDGELVEEFRGLGEATRSRNVLQDRLNQAISES